MQFFIFQLKNFCTDIIQKYSIVRNKSSNASKVAFYTLLQELKEKNYLLLDCQVYNDHLASLGAFEIPRAEFMQILLKGNISLRVKKLKQTK